MTISIQAITDALVSHAQLIGEFDRVANAEPKTPPAPGLTCAVWAQHLGSTPITSGLASTSAYLVMNIRIYRPMIEATPEEADAIDPSVLKAVDKLIDSLSGEFTLAGLVCNIDLLGAGGTSLAADAGYVQIGGRDTGMYRIMTITVPMIINDAWSQVP